MLPGIPRRRRSRQPITGTLHRAAHGHGRTIAIAGLTAGLLAGTAAGAVMFVHHGRTAPAPDQTAGA
jgi:hypothetical protein